MNIPYTYTYVIIKYNTNFKSNLGMIMKLFQTLTKELCLVLQTYNPSSLAKAKAEAGAEAEEQRWGQRSRDGSRGAEMGAKVGAEAGRGRGSGHKFKAFFG